MGLTTAPGWTAVSWARGAAVAGTGEGAVCVRTVVATPPPRTTRIRESLSAISISVRPVSTSTAARARMVSGSMGIRVNDFPPEYRPPPARPWNSAPTVSRRNDTLTARVAYATHRVQFWGDDWR